MVAVMAFAALLVDGQAASAQGAASSVRVLSLTLPATFGDYVQTRRVEFDDPALGVSYFYESAGDSGQARVDVLVYERDSLSMALSPVDAIARKVALFHRMLVLDKALGTPYKIIRDGADTTVVTGSGQPVAGHHVRASQRRGREATLTYFSVFAIGNGFIKLECRVPADGAERRNVAGLFTAIVRQTLAGL
jgi:hypothetical protein